ncbi:alpha-ketoglutarate-dependent dioxygenase AlkB [Phenylobacterium sp.]|jgi:alkylated DNA repair dioxygenase AlkB|uniref:alpha-ketoglutarate-dependent dioxygenase AlkB n=1 Tax=Phenylobacterium sp. TaxID=1871053 RepID=UPI002F91E9A3
MSSQLGLFEQPPPAPDLPPGFVYRPDFLSAAEEAQIAAELAKLPFEPFQFRGFEARRRVHSFGYRYDFDRGRLEHADPIPDWLEAARARAEAFAGLPEGGLQQLLINEYLPGAPIGWHRDRPQFEKVVGISVGAPCTFRLRRRVSGGFERKSLTLAPRSAYLVAGEAREAWEHSIPPVAEHRYSVTFRSFRQGRDPGTHAA